MFTLNDHMPVSILGLYRRDGSRNDLIVSENFQRIAMSTHHILEVQQRPRVRLFAE